jgi:predicted nucleic acid-binding protein
MKYLDANVFIRYISQDDEAKAADCLRLFERLSHDEEECFITESVVGEVVYVLTSPALGYLLAAEGLGDALRPLLQFPSIELPNKTRCLRALDIYSERPFLGFEDALIIAHMEAEGIGEVYSYDRDFDRVPGLTRVEP